MSWNVQQQTNEERGDVSPAGAAWSRARGHAGQGQRRAAAGEGRETGSLRGTRGSFSTEGQHWGDPRGSERAGCTCDPRGRLRAAPALRLGTLPHGRGLPREHPTGASRGVGARQPVPAVPALPACARGAWLGMNVARGGLCPGEQHTRPCALSREGRGGGGTGAAVGRERRRARAGAWPASAQPAGPGKGAVAAALPGAVLAMRGGMARPGTARGCGSGWSPGCHPAVRAAGAWGLRPPTAALGPRAGRRRVSGSRRAQAGPCRSRGLVEK